MLTSSAVFILPKLITILRSDAILHKTITKIQKGEAAQSVASPSWVLGREVQGTVTKRQQKWQDFAMVMFSGDRQKHDA